MISGSSKNRRRETRKKKRKKKVNCHSSRSSRRRRIKEGVERGKSRKRKKKKKEKQKKKKEEAKKKRSRKKRSRKRKKKKKKREEEEEGGEEATEVKARIARPRPPRRQGQLAAHPRGRRFNKSPEFNNHLRHDSHNTRRREDLMKQYTQGFPAVFCNLLAHDPSDEHFLWFRLSTDNLSEVYSCNHVRLRGSIMPTIRAGETW